MPSARRAVAALATLALAIGLAGCWGTSGSPPRQSTARASATPSSATPASTTSKDDGPLTFWVMGDSTTGFQRLVAPFTKGTGIAVHAVAVPWNAVDQRFRAAIASGKGPDLLQIGLTNLPTQAASGALLNLKDAFAGGGALAEHNFLPHITGAATSSAGDVSSVPWIADTRVLFYRSDILKAAGIDSPPTTWDELRADAKTLAARGKGEYGFSIPQTDSALPVELTWDQGGDVVDGSGRLRFDTPAFDRAVDLYLGLYADGSVPTAKGFGQQRGFISGVLPMLVSGPYLARAITAVAPSLKGKWSVAPLPAARTNTSLFAGSNIGVWAATRHKASALKLLDYLAQPATQARLFAMSGNLPTVKAAYDRPELRADPFVATYRQQLLDAKLLPQVENWDGGAGAALLKALNAIALHGANRERTLQQLSHDTAKYRVG